jgi:sugar lactone lactonase YvrE
MTVIHTFVLVCSSLLTLSDAGCKKSEPPQGGTRTTSGSTATAGGSAVTAGGSAITAGGSAAPADKRIVIKDVGLATPESALYEPAADVFLISNVNGGPAEVDDNGFISKITPDGKVAELKWIDGARPDVKLDAPKGLAISGGFLWVADITVVRKFDVRTGAPRGEVKIPGATFLNDVTAGDDGSVYVTDSGVDAKLQPSGTDAVHHVAKDGKVTALFKSKDLGAPNGLVHVAGSVWVVTFSSGEVYEITDQGEKKASVKPPKGQLDGVLARPNGELLVASWEGKAIYAGKPGGEWRTLLADIEAPADIGWDSKRNVLIVAQFTTNALTLLPL